MASSSCLAPSLPGGFYRCRHAAPRLRSGLDRRTVVRGWDRVATDWLIPRRIDYDPESTIVAIGLLYIIQEAIGLYGPEARSVEAPYYFRSSSWFGYSGYKLIVAGISAALLLATWLALTRTNLGLYMRATQYDQETAQAFGISVRRIYATGSRWAPGWPRSRACCRADSAGPLLMGHDPLLLSFIVVIIGGLGSLGGSGRGLRDRDQRWRDLRLLLADTGEDLATLLVALVLVFRPSGLFGAREP